MMRFTIRCNGYLCGTYAGNTDVEALDLYAQSEGFATFQELLATRGLRREDFDAEPVKEG